MVHLQQNSLPELAMCICWEYVATFTPDNTVVDLDAKMLVRQHTSNNNSEAMHSNQHAAKACTILYVFHSCSDGVENEWRGWRYAVYTKRTCQIHKPAAIPTAFDALVWNFVHNLGEHLDDSDDDNHDVITTNEEEWDTSAVTYRMWTSVFIISN